MARIVPELALYAAASALALGTDVATFLALTGFGLPPPIAGGLGYGLGLWLHFTLSTRFVFPAAGKSGPRLLAEFTATGLAGLLLTVSVIWLATSAGLTPAAAKAIAVSASFAAVYVLRRRLVFTRSEPSLSRG